MTKISIAMNEIRTGRQCVFQLYVHWVFVTKYRKRIFDKKAIELVRTVFDSVCQDFEAQLIEMEGKPIMSTSW